MLPENAIEATPIVGLSNFGRTESTSKSLPLSNSAHDLTAIRSRWRDEFRDGARSAFLMRFDGDREAGGYPRGFLRWPLDRRNAWFCGFNVGRNDRLRLAREMAK
jgi:hypothetical protein